MIDGEFINFMIRDHAKIHLIANQTYEMKSTIRVYKTHHVTLIGDNTTLVFTKGVDGLVIKDSDYFKMRGIKIIICESENEKYPNAGFVAEGANYFDIQFCSFYCTMRNYGFGIYLAGPTVWDWEKEIHKDYEKHEMMEIINSTTLVFYEKNKLMIGNKFNNNTVVCGSEHDGVTLALQYGAEFKNNTIFGCRLAVYMSKLCTIEGNHLKKSRSHGIYISTPCDDLRIIENRIDNPQCDGIKVDEQGEHDRKYIDFVLTHSNQIEIIGNHINCHIGNTDVCAVTLIGIQNSTINDNTILTSGLGIVLRGAYEHEPNRYDEHGNPRYRNFCEYNEISNNYINVIPMNHHVVNSSSSPSSCILLAEYSRQNIIRDNHLLCELPNRRNVIEFSEIVTKYKIVDGERLPDEGNEYIYNVMNNLIMDNKMYVSTGSQISLNDLIKLDFDVTLRNYLDGNSVVNIMSITDMLL
jgi:hypothetical protein